MKITFFQPKYSNIWENLGVGYIASYTRARFGNKIKMKFYNLNFDSFDDIKYKMLFSDIVAFSATTPTYPECVKIAKWIRERSDFPHIVLGGWHATATPDTIDPVFDQIVVGEGEKAFWGIINDNRDKIVYGTQLPFSQLLWPDRDLIQQERTLQLCEDICGERILSIQSRRGCSHNCTFCSENLMTCNTEVRVRDPIDTLNEIEYATNIYKITRFKFVDATWGHPVDAVERFCKEKIARGNTLPFEAMCHIAYMDLPLLKLIKKAGCDQLNFGVESGSQKLLNDMNKGLTISKIKKVFQWSKFVGIKRRAFFILGMPNETGKTIGETIKLIEEIKPDVVGFSLLCPYPGNQYWKREYEKEDFSEMDEYSNFIWNSKYFSNGELRDIQKELNIEFNHILVSHKR